MDYKRLIELLGEDYKDTDIWYRNKWQPLKTYIKEKENNNMSPIDLKKYDSSWNGELKNDNEGKSGAIEIVPEGKYKVRVDKYDTKESKNGTPYLELELVIDLCMTSEPKNIGRKLWKKLWLTPKALPITMNNIKEISGRDLKKVSDIEQINFTKLPAFIVKVKHNEWNDKMYAEVTSMWKESEEVTEDYSETKEDEIPF